ARVLPAGAFGNELRDEQPWRARAGVKSSERLGLMSALDARSAYAACPDGRLDDRLSQRQPGQRPGHQGGAGFDDRTRREQRAPHSEIGQIGLVEIPAHEIGRIEDSGRFESVEPCAVVVEGLVIVPGGADYDCPRAVEGLEWSVPRRALDPESSLNEGVRETAIARARLRPRATGRENDAIRHASVSSLRSIAALGHDPAAVGLEHLAREVVRGLRSEEDRAIRDVLDLTE